MSESIFSGQLKVLGFDNWGEEERLRDFDILPFPESELPCFFRVQLKKNLKFTFVVDEYHYVWAADALIDLSPFGFNEIEFDGNEKPFPLLQ